MTDIDDIRERHVEARSQTTGMGKGICRWCGDTGDRWPCDTRIVVDALDACMKLRSERHRNADICPDHADHELAAAVLACAYPGCYRPKADPVHVSADAIDFGSGSGEHAYRSIKTGIPTVDAAIIAALEDKP